MDGVLVTVKHLRVAKFCMRGARIWFDRHALDFNEFIRLGLPVEQIEKTDALGRQVAEIARQDAAGELDNE